MKIKIYVSISVALFWDLIWTSELKDKRIGGASPEAGPRQSRKAVNCRHLARALPKSPSSRLLSEVLLSCKSVWFVSELISIWP